jgi:hypothetical protein
MKINHDSYKDIQYLGLIKKVVNVKKYSYLIG